MKNNRFFLAVGVLLAMALVVSCSDDKDSGGAAVVSCKKNDSCWEVSASYNFGDDSPETECGYDSGVFSNEGCPSGWSKTCDDGHGTTYLYGENRTCEYEN